MCSCVLAYINSEMLQTPDIDSALLACVQVAASDAEVAGGTDHATGQTQRVVREDRLRCSIVVLLRKWSCCLISSLRTQVTLI